MNRQKHKLSRRILAVLLMAAMLITMLPSAMFAWDGGGSGEPAGQTETVKTSGEGVTSFDKTATRTGASTWDMTMNVQPSKSIESVPMNVVLVLDRSNSMDEWVQSERQTRLEVVQEAACNLADKLSAIGNINVGLVSFAGSANNEWNFQTLNSENVWKLQSKINDLEVASYTNITAGLKNANDMLKNASGEKVVILLSDGDHNPGWGYVTGPVDYAKDSMDNDIVVHTVGFAYGDQWSTLGQIANATGGSFYRADDADQLVSAFNNIANKIIAMVDDKVGSDVSIVSDQVTSTPQGNIVVGQENNADTFSWNPINNQALSKEHPLKISYTVQLNKTPEQLWETAIDGVAEVVLNQSATLTYRVDQYSKDPLTLEPLTTTVDLAKISEATQVDGGEVAAVTNSDQYTIVYENETSAISDWKGPEATKPSQPANLQYTNTSLEKYNGEKWTTVAEDVSMADYSFTPEDKGEYRLVHHYSTDMNGTDVTLQVYVDGQQVSDPTNYVTVSRNETSNYNHFKASGPVDGVMTYDFDYNNDGGFNCVDISVAVNSDDYILQGVQYNQSGGKSGEPSNVEVSSNTYNIDNLVAGSLAEDGVETYDVDCTIYLNTKYSVEYYLNDQPLDSDDYEGQYEDDNVYIIGKSVTQSTDLADGVNAVKAVEWMNNGYVTPITLESLPEVSGHSVSGWFLANDSETVYIGQFKNDDKSYIDADKADSPEGKSADGVIKFYATSTPKAAVSGIAKDVVTDEDSLPENIQTVVKDEDIRYPSTDDKKLTVEQGDNVTLLYKLTVTGGVGAEFTVSDEEYNAKLVSVEGATLDQEAGDHDPFTGKLTAGTAAIYVIVDHGTMDNVGTETLTNTATVSNTDPTLNPSEPPSDDETVTVEITPNIPTDDELGKIAGAVQVTCDNTEPGHGEKQTIDYKLSAVEDGYTRPDPDQISGDANGYTYTLTINKEAFASKYNTDVEGSGHTIVSPEDALTLTLKYDSEKGWIAPSAAVLTVHCDTPATITGIEKDVVAKGDTLPTDVDASKYTLPSGNQVMINEGESVTLLYKITVSGTNATFRVADAGTEFVAGDVTKNDRNEYVGEIEGKGSVVFYVSKTFEYKDIVEADFKLGNTAEVYLGDEEEPSDSDPADDVTVDVTPKVPDEEDIKDLLNDGTVDLTCTSVETHVDESLPYDLVEGTYTVSDELGYDAEKGYYTVDVTVDPVNYIKTFDEAVNKGHSLDGEEQDDTIVLKFVKGQWALVDDADVTFNVVCDNDLTGIDKAIVTTGDAENAAKNAGVAVDQYLIPENTTDAVAVPENGSVTLLYSITVNGAADSHFVVKDENAQLVASNINDEAQISADSEAGTFTGVMPKDSKWVTFYVSRTFTTADLEANDGYLVNSVELSGKDGTTVDPDEDKNTDEEKIPGETVDASVTIQPANVTIYEGGKGGYDAVGEGSANSDSLPHPMFYITTPDGVNAEGLTFGNGEKTWTVEYDGVDAEGDALYHFTEGEGQDPVRVTYTYVDQTTGKETTVLADDLDELDNVADVYTYLRIDLYPGDNELEAVKANANGVDYEIVTKSGQLTVRAVEADEPNTVTSDIQETAPTEDRGTAVAVEPKNTTYTFNNTKVVLPADSRPSLLFDNIINDEGTNRTAALEDKADQKLNANDGDYNYEIMYLDLVDANNGNAWIKSSAGTDIYWDYPEGTDKNTDFEVLHFTDLHRDGEKSGFDIKDLENITMNEIENVTIAKTDDYIVFHVEEANFSPYALAWEDDSSDTPDYPDYPIWTPDGDDDGPSGLNTEDHFSYVVGYAEDYRTGEATDNEDLWPVKPNNQITRAEVATIFYRLLEDEVRDEYDTTTNDFSDVTADSWYNQTVSTLARMGIVKGYEDGSFRPNAPITRAEFGAIATRFFAETGATYEPGTFTDVTGDEWYANAIQDAVNLGLIGGYPDGTVRPNNNITRAEACAIVNRTLGRVPDADHLLPEDVMKVWPDNNPTDWFYADMQEATNGHEYAWIEEDGHEIEEWTNLLDKDWTDR